MAAVATAPSHAPTLFTADADDMKHHISDPRILSPSTPLSRADSASSNHHPDLSNEIALLSTKLVNAINHQTTLDDRLQEARHELELARKQVLDLNATTKKHESLVADGSLIKKDDVDSLRCQLQRELAEAQKSRLDMEKAKEHAQQELVTEHQKRITAEKARKEMEQELETLTSALFEEANGMVSNARKETEASERRNDQLKNQLKDAEVLLQSHQEQLQDLKAVVEKISSERDENESSIQPSTAPSTPGMAPHDKMSRLFDAASLTPVTPGMDDVQPDQPLRFSHLITPALRHDLNAFEDFRNLTRAAAKATPAPSRVASGSYGSINVLGIERADASKTSKPSSPAVPATPTTLSSPKLRESTFTVPALKDTPVYKRALAEDIEPTLRLDIAPGVGWMGKRTILGSITAGTLVVEPMPPPISRFRGPAVSCALCGESRKGEQYLRKLCFRTAETEDAQRYPLCEFCLGRVRTSCDYVAFLRMIRDGHWRAETDEEVNAAWEESVKLRERMFWQRIGGGVLPAYMQSKDSPKSPVFGQGRCSEESRRVAPTLPPRNSSEDPFNKEKKPKRVSIGRTFVANGQGDQVEFILSSGDEQRIEDEAAQQLHDEIRHSYASKSSGTDTVRDLDESESSAPTSQDGGFTTPAETPSKEIQRLSLTIPGGFN